MNKLTVGQQLWWVPIHYSNRGDPIYVTVEKVGRKWAQLSNGRRIDVATLEADGKGYTSPGHCYLQREECEAKLELKAAWSDLREYMQSRIFSGAPSGVTLEQIKAAGKLLGHKLQ